MNGPIFLDSCVKGPIFLISWYMHIFFAQRFFEAASPLGFTWTDCDICVKTSKKWVQKVKGQYMNRSTFWMIKYMNGSVFSKARYMNGVGFEILARTPVPAKITPKLLPLPQDWNRREAPACPVVAFSTPDFGITKPRFRVQGGGIQMIAVVTVPTMYWTYNPWIAKRAHSHWALNTSVIFHNVYHVSYIC